MAGTKERTYLVYFQLSNYLTPTLPSFPIRAIMKKRKLEHHNGSRLTWLGKNRKEMGVGVAGGTWYSATISITAIMSPTITN